MAPNRITAQTAARPLPEAEPVCYHNRAAASAVRGETGTNQVGVFLTTGAVIDVDRTSGIDFSTSFQDQQGSNNMWLYSLYPLRALGEAIRDGRVDLRPFYRAGWTSAVAHLCSEAEQAALDRLPSGDHAAATRLRACLEAGPLLDDPELLSSIRHVGDATVEWLIMDSNYRANNHGLMSSIALLYWAAEVMSGGEAAAVRSTAIDRILSLAERAFDDRGLCDENTIGYHNFNLSCYDEVLALHGTHALDPRIDSVLRPILERAQDALNICVLQDGTVPTIGDSGRYMVRRAESANSAGCFPQSGFGVLKNDHFYLSVICGARSEVHKHVDDSSMTLWWNGDPLIVDTGSYLYDRTDPYRRTMESSLGHSGIFLDDLDGLLRTEIVRDQPDYWAALDDFRPGTTSSSGELHCSYGLGDRARVDRRIRLIDSRWIAVRDVVRIESSSLIPRATQRWLVGPQMSPVRLGHGHWWFSSETDSPGLTIMALGHADEELYAAEEWGKYRGWYSEQYRRRQSTSGLDFRSTGRLQVHATVLAIGDNPVVDRGRIPSEALELVHGFDGD